MKSVIATLVLLFAVGCTSSTPTPSPTPTPTPTPVPIGCKLEQDVANGIAGAVATSLSCTGQAAIAADILAAAGKANLCPTAAAVKLTLQSTKNRNKGSKINEQGVIGDVACPLIVKALQSAALSKVPVAWGCAGGTTVDGIAAVVTAKCEALVTF